MVLLKRSWLVLIGFLFFACGQNSTKKKGNDAFLQVQIDYAKGFRINRHKDYTQLTVLNPWQQSKGVQFDYFLVDRSVKSLPEELNGKTVIRTPINRIICLSTSHIAFLSALHENSTIKGLSGASFVSDSLVRSAIKRGEVVDVGYDQSINYEMIIRSKPDVIMAYGVGGEVTGFLNKLKDLGMTVVLNGEYLESTPLAKAEWIKLVGELYQKQDEANQYFEMVKKNYLTLRQLASNSAEHPKVFAGLPYKDAWWMAGGASNLAALISDAGGDYLWKENSSREAFVVSLEEVVMRSASADYWINCGTVNSISELIATDSRFETFPQVKKKTVYNNNNLVNSDGGNGYWELGVVRPDMVLKDLIRIFHPGLIPSQPMTFYKQLH